MTHPDHRRDTDLEGGGAPNPHYQGERWPPPDDEISLFDLWDGLVRRRWLILGVAALVTVLAAAYALSRPDVHRYQASLRIGQTVLESEDGEVKREPIATPAEVTAQLESSMIPAALRQVLGLDEEALAGGGANIPHVQVSSPEDVGIVHLRIEGPEERASTYRDILWDAASRLVRAQADVISTERTRLTRQLEQLERRQGRVTKQLEDIRTRIDRLANTDGTSESAVALRIDGLQQRAGELHDRLLDIEAERDRTNDYLAIIKEHAGVFTDKLDRETLSAQQEAANRIAAMSGGIRPTIVISSPERALTRVGTSGTLILALGIVLGVMLGIFSGFAAEFIAAARRRHQPLDDT